MTASLCQGGLTHFCIRWQVKSVGKGTPQSGWETSSEAGLVMAQGRGHYLAHVRLPFKCGHGSSHHPLHSTGLRDAEVLQRERQVVTTLWHLRSRGPPPSVGGPSSLLCFLQSHSTPNYPSQLHGLPRHSSEDCPIRRKRASPYQHRGKLSFLWSRNDKCVPGPNFLKDGGNLKDQLWSVV